MIKKIALAVAFALTLCPMLSLAQVSIRIGPPPPVYEHRGPPPERGYVWVKGYHRYDNDHYAWNAGHYERPPREHQRWVGAKWVHRHGEWVMVEGHWR